MSENQQDCEEDINNKDNNNNISVDPRPKELLDIVFALESEKQALVEESRKRITTLRRDLEESQNENERLKRKVQQLENSLKQSMILGDADASKTRQEQDELLMKAKTLLFEKTKVNKQQEQQIQTLKSQVEAVKDVAKVTKDMLNLKTAECEHMQVRLEKSQHWIKAERDKCALTEKKLEISKGVYDKLRSEYDIQSSIFKNLKEAYEQKINVLSGALEKAKATQ